MITKGWFTIPATLMDGVAQTGVAVFELVAASGGTTSAAVDRIEFYLTRWKYIRHASMILTNRKTRAYTREILAGVSVSTLDTPTTSLLSCSLW